MIKENYFKIEDGKSTLEFYYPQSCRFHTKSGGFYYTVEFSQAEVFKVLGKYLKQKKYKMPSIKIKPIKL